MSVKCRSSSSNGQGSVRLNTASSGAAIPRWNHLLSSGLGVCHADSSVTVNLAGYSVLVADRCPECLLSSSVIFQVYGDGNLLYQSSAVTSLGSNTRQRERSGRAAAQLERHRLNRQHHR